MGAGFFLAGAFFFPFEGPLAVVLITERAAKGPSKGKKKAPVKKKAAPKKSSAKTAPVKKAAAKKTES